MSRIRAAATARLAAVEQAADVLRDQVHLQGPGRVRVAHGVGQVRHVAHHHALVGDELARVIGPEWGPHLKVMCDFWSSVMLTTGKYKGRPIPAHVKIAEIAPGHFTEWLELFEATARELFAPALAASFVEKAKRIGERLKLGIAFHAKTPEVWAELPPRAIPLTTVR